MQVGTKVKYKDELFKVNKSELFAVYQHVVFTIENILTSSLGDKHVMLSSLTVKPTGWISMNDLEEI